MWPFAPQCPVDEATQVWIQQRMLWLAGQFGMTTWRNAQAAEPTQEFFPDPYDGTEAAVLPMLKRVCGYMGVASARIHLEFYEERGSAGKYIQGEREVVAIGRSQLKDPLSIVATLAHELAHARLLGENRMAREEADLEPVTDLAAIFFGMGIFHANTFFQYSQWTDGRMSGWKAARKGYLDENKSGYALGLWAAVRGENNPRWMRHLNLNPRSYMKETLRCLRQHPPEGFPI